jgi:hypothetical protein
MTTFSLYRQAQLRAWNGQLNWQSDTIVMTQHTASYAPNLDTDAFVSNLTSEVATGAGYTQGGIILSGKTALYTPANAWGQQWQPNTPYAVGQVVRPPVGNGLVFRCVAGGSSAAFQPSWPSLGLTVTDGTATWQAIAAGAVQLSALNAQWQSYSGTLRYLVVSDRTQGIASAQPLIALADLGVSSTGTGGNFSVSFDPSGIVVIWSA